MTSNQEQQWDAFAYAVSEHIRNYVLPQYGDVELAPEKGYTTEDFIKQSQRYLARFGRQSRTGEELLDLIKAAHWIQKAFVRIAKAQGVKLVNAPAQPEYNAAHNAIVSVLKIPTAGFASADELATTILDALNALPVVAPQDMGDHLALGIDHCADEDAEVVRLAVTATIRALGGDPNAYVTDYGTTVLDLTLRTINCELAKEATG